MKIMREETFGPAIPLMEYDTFDQAIAYANDCVYGLGACLLTSDALKAKMFMEEVKAGTVLDQRSADRQLRRSVWRHENEWGRARTWTRRTGRIPRDKTRALGFCHQRKPWWYPYGNGE